METKSNLYALAALRERRAEIAGSITEAERRLRHLRETLVHVDGTIRLFSDIEPESIPAKRPYKRVKLFGQGKLNRMIMDVLRNAQGPLTTSQVIEAIVAALNFGPDAAKGMKNRVRANLLYLNKVRGLVVKDGGRETATWRLCESG